MAGGGKGNVGLGLEYGGHFGVGSRGGVELVVVAFGRRVAFEHNSECVCEDREYGVLLIPGRNVGLGSDGGNGGKELVVGAFVGLGGGCVSEVDAVGVALGIPWLFSRWSMTMRWLIRSSTMWGA